MPRSSLTGDPFAAAKPPFPPGIIDQLGYGVVSGAQRSPSPRAKGFWDPRSCGVPPINLADFDEVWKYRGWLSVGTPYLPELLKSIRYRCEEWPQRFDRPEHMYTANACLFACSESALRLNFCRCSRLGKAGKYGFATGRCQQWRICPYCSHKRRIELLRRFLPVFGRGRWWFMTISPQQLCAVDSGSICEIRNWWEGYRYGVRQLVDQGDASGAWVFETLSVNSYWPAPMGLPHVHVLVQADQVTHDTIAFLKAALASYTGQKWDAKKKQWAPRTTQWLDVYDREILDPFPLPYPVSTCTYEIREQKDMAAIISYLCNPINFAEAYVTQWPQVEGVVFDAGGFNENAWEAINCFEGAIVGRWGHYYLGTLHHSHSVFAGIKKQRRETEEHRARVKRLLNLCAVEQLESDPLEHIGTSVEERYQEQRDAGDDRAKS